MLVVSRRLIDKLHHLCVGIYVLYMKLLYLRSIYGLHANNQFHLAFTGLLPKLDESLPSFNVSIIVIL